MSFQSLPGQAQVAIVRQLNCNQRITVGLIVINRMLHPATAVSHVLIQATEELRIWLLKYALGNQFEQGANFLSHIDKQLGLAFRTASSGLRAHQGML